VRKWQIKNSLDLKFSSDVRFELAATLRGSRTGCNPHTHYDVIDDVITRKLPEIEKKGDHLAP